MDPGPISFTLLYRLLLLALFSFTCILLPFYHSICSILCLQQTDEIDNLIVGAKFLVVLCAGSTLPLVQSKALDEAPYKFSGAVAKLASINLLNFGFLLLVR
jgi:hypothetical protein